MLSDQINKKREELNSSIEKGENYSNIYKLSVELDNLISDYYKETQMKKKKKKIKKNIKLRKKKIK